MTWSALTETEIRKLVTSHIYSIAFDNDLDKPESCFNGWSGEIPEDGIFLVHINSGSSCNDKKGYMDKLSNDPYIPVNKARENCAKMEFAVNF